MALMSNLGTFAGGTRLNLGGAGDGTVGLVSHPNLPALGGGPVTIAPSPAGGGAGVVAPPSTILGTGSTVGVPPHLTIPPGVIDVPPIFHPPIGIGPFPITPVRPAATQLARGAIDQLNGANADTLKEAVNALKNRSLTGDAAIAYLERKVRIGEVLGNHARDWSDQTKKDFADAFQMQPDKVDTMDSIVSIAILNDRDLEAEIHAENTPQTGTGDLLQNRKVVWQYPNPGTVLTPPYLILIAVDYQDVASGDQVVQSILSQLDTYQGLRLPKTAIQRLQG